MTVEDIIAETLKKWEELTPPKGLYGLQVFEWIDKQQQALLIEACNRAAECERPPRTK